MFGKLIALTCIYAVAWFTNIRDELKKMNEREK